jgi:hypothetical protein
VAAVEVEVAVVIVYPSAAVAMVVVVVYPSAAVAMAVVVVYPSAAVAVAVVIVYPSAAARASAKSAGRSSCLFQDSTEARRAARDRRRAGAQ